MLGQLAQLLNFNGILAKQFAEFSKLVLEIWITRGCRFEAEIVIVHIEFLHEFKSSKDHRFFRKQRCQWHSCCCFRWASYILLAKIISGLAFRTSCIIGVVRFFAWLNSIHSSLWYIFTFNSIQSYKYNINHILKLSEIGFFYIFKSYGCVTLSLSLPVLGIRYFLECKNVQEISYVYWILALILYAAFMMDFLL